MKYEGIWVINYGVSMDTTSPNMEYIHNKVKR